MTFSAVVRNIKAMETVVSFHKTEDAYLFCTYLESEGIPAHVFDEFSHRVTHHKMFNDMVRVVVSGEDLERAIELFREYETRVTAAPAVVGDVKFWPLALLTTIVGVLPFMFSRRKPPE